MLTKVFNVAILISMAAFFSTCTPRFDCANTTYNFEIGVKAYPDNDSINIGDTLWIEINEPTTFKDLISGNEINYNNAANLGMGISFLEFLQDTISQGAIKNFNLTFIKGSKVINNYDPSSLIEVLFTEADGYYQFKLGIVAQNTGRFVVTISNAANVYRSNDACTKASFAINFKETNQHFYYLQSWRPDLTLDESGKNKVYYFKVN